MIVSGAPCRNHQDHILRWRRCWGPHLQEYFVGGNSMSPRTDHPLRGDGPSGPADPSDARSCSPDQRDGEAGPVDAPWDAPRARGGNLTFRDWVRHHSVNPDVAELLLSYLQPTFGSDGHTCRCCSAVVPRASGNETTRAVRAVLRHRGRTLVRSSAAPDSSAAAARPSASGGVDAAVLRIEQRGDHALVTSDRVRSARRVVVAAPPDTVWDRLVPSLPAKRMHRSTDADGRLMRPTPSTTRRSGATRADRMGISTAVRSRRVRHSPATPSRRAARFFGGRRGSGTASSAGGPSQGGPGGVRHMSAPRALERSSTSSTRTDERWSMGGPVASSAQGPPRPSGHDRAGRSSGALGRHGDVTYGRGTGRGGPAGDAPQRGAERLETHDHRPLAALALTLSVTSTARPAPPRANGPAGTEGLLAVPNPGYPTS